VHSRRLYREWAHSAGLVSFTVTVDETDLFISASRDLAREALSSVTRHRAELRQYFHIHPRFATSLQPVVARDDAPAIVKDMAAAALSAGIGPLSAVAGAVAEAVARDLLTLCDEVIVENGGDIFIQSRRERTVGLYAGDSPLSGRVGLLMRPEKTPVGVCTSSSSFGHSLSLGKADACTVVADSAAVADSFATMLCNRVSHPEALDDVLLDLRLPGSFRGVALTFGERLVVQGDVELVRISTPGANGEKQRYVTP